MSKFRWKLNLQMFSEETGDAGVEQVPAAEEHATPQEIVASEPGANSEVAAEPEKQNNFEKAFAKRLADAQAKWEAEAQEKYKGHEDYKYLADYLQEANGLDVMTLKEQIELERLNARAEREQVSPEVLRRIDELESKAAKADQLEQQQQEGQRVQTYFDSLGKFVDGKGVSTEQLNQFMIENGLMYDPANMEKSFNVAFKAMMHDQLSQQVETAKKDGVKEFLAAKGSIPTVHGTHSQGQVVSGPPKTFAEARQRAYARDFSQT